MSEPDEQLSVPSNPQDAVRFVEVLADEQDYWLSLTDAARITRTSEAMARRWVSSGRLPVKKEPVGINQRTRLVRASDVARLRPIVDPTAAITDEIHKLDLLSIPRQQKQMQQEHQVLQAAVQTLQTESHTTHIALAQATTQLQQLAHHVELQFEDLQRMFRQALEDQQRQSEAVARQVAGQSLEIERLSKESREQQVRHQQDLELLQANLQAMQAQVQQQFAQRDQDQQEQRLDQERTIAALLQKQREQVVLVLTGVQDTLTQQAQKHEQFQQALAMFQQRLQTMQEAWRSSVAQQIGEVKAGLEQCLAELLHEQTQSSKHIQEMTLRLQRVERQSEETSTAWTTDHGHLKTQQLVIEQLTEQLQEEREARKILSEQVAIQQEQFQKLARELADLMEREQRAGS
jgi:chromosome segregation ATPase